LVSSQAALCRWASSQLMSIKHAHQQVGPFLLDQVYQRGIKVSDQEMKDLNLVRCSICPTWNYAIKLRYASL
jgi:hypothetical protein